MIKVVTGPHGHNLDACKPFVLITICWAPSTVAEVKEVILLAHADQAEGHLKIAHNQKLTCRHLALKGCAEWM